jgi:hypothetical protein
MSYNRVVISSGHGKHVRGAAGVLDEVDEARRVVDRVVMDLNGRGVHAVAYHDDVSTSQDENLGRIVDFHNSQGRDLDVSVHFNAYVETEKPMGTEVLYTSQAELAAQLSAAIAGAGGFINRGAKLRYDLFFLNNTAEPAVLIEVCFVDSDADAKLYRTYFDLITEAIADVIGGDHANWQPPQAQAALHVTGKVSQFGGPEDEGVDEDEGLAFIDDIDDAPHLFLPYQPEDTTGLARRLNPFVHYIACRWDYGATPKETLLESVAQVRALKTGVTLTAFPADWGPHESTGRVADLSPGLMADLGITTDDEVEVIYPWEAGA